MFTDTTAVVGKSATDIAQLLIIKKKNRGSVTAIADRLGNPEPVVGDWLLLTPKDKLPQPEKVAYPKPPKAADGSLIYERIPNKVEVEKIPLNATSPAIVLKRRLEDVNGVVDNSKCIIQFFTKRHIDY